MKKNIYRLNELEPGDHGVIVRVEGSGEVHRRLLDMGVVRGAKLTFAKVAPLGDPLGIIIKGFHLSLRNKEAEQIIVEKKD